MKSRSAEAALWSAESEILRGIWGGQAARSGVDVVYLDMYNVEWMEHSSRELKQCVGRRMRRTDFA